MWSVIMLQLHVQELLYRWTFSFLFCCERLYILKKILWINRVLQIKFVCIEKNIYYLLLQVLHTVVVRWVNPVLKPLYYRAGLYNNQLVRRTVGGAASVSLSSWAALYITVGTWQPCCCFESLFQRGECEQRKCCTLLSLSSHHGKALEQGT